MTKLGPEAQRLVDGGRSALRPSASDKARVLEALRARLATPPGVPDDTSRDNAAPGPTARPSPFSWGRASALAAGAVVVGAVGLHYLRGGSVVTDAPSAPSQSALAVTAAPPAPSQSAPVNPTVALVPVNEPAVAVPPPSSQSTPVEGSAPRRASDRLGEEVSILSRAEAELHAGHFAGALRLLDEHQRRFPNGKLAEERNAAKAQAARGLAATGTH